jgi:nitroreductase
VPDTDQVPHGDPLDQQSLAEPMRSRRSTSVFDDRYELTDSELELLLTAARWAPSWGNLQPWAFVVARRGGPAHQALLPRLRRGNSIWVPRASLVLLTAAQIAPAQEGDGFKDAGSSCYDLGQAAAHLTLQATAMGLSAHQFAGFDRQGTAEDVGVPAHFRVLSGIAVGRHGDPAAVSERDREREQRPRRRRSIEEFVYVDHWGQPWSGGSV